MSALTKVFVVLHVVLTMLFVAATIVFVNRVEDFKGQQAKAANELAIVQRQAGDAESRAQTALAEAAAVRIQAGNEVGRIRQQYNTALTDIRERDTQIATLNSNLASADARLQAATAALATAQESNKLLQGQITETRTVSDKIQEENTQLLTANADINSKLQSATRAFQNAQEEIEELRTQNAELADRGTPAPAGGARASADAQQPGITPAQPIAGEIRDKRNVNGVTYATISIGSQDQVTENMVFNVIEKGPDGNFLGYLRVDRVEPNEAIGRLEGPRVADMKPGNEVRTQL